MAFYFLIGFILAIIAVGLYIGFIDKIAEPLDMGFGGIFWGGVALFVVILLLWAVVLPVGAIAGVILLVRKPWKEA